MIHRAEITTDRGASIVEGKGSPAKSDDPSLSAVEDAKSAAESDNNRAAKKPQEFINGIVRLLIGFDYFFIGNFAHHMTRQTIHKKRKLRVHTIMVYIFLGLNFYVFVADCILHQQRHLSFFVGALCLRAIFLPVFALFHPFVGFLFHSVDHVLQWSFRGAAILSVLAMIAGFVFRATTPGILTAFRFTELPPLPPDWSNASGSLANLAVCRGRYEGLSVVEAIGLALGGYDVTRSEAVFSRQLDFFFGPGAIDRISYEVENIAPDVPMVIYNVSGTTVFAFRGFATGRELLIQIQMLAQYYVAPFFLQMMPFYDMINNQYLSSFSASAHFFGLHWFTPRSQFDEWVQKVSAIYEDRAIPADAPVLFVGINTGGLLAKTLGIMKKRRGISFVSLPVSTAEFQYRYAFPDTEMQWASNVVNTGTWFGVEDPDVGENFVLAGDHEILRQDEVYPSFCNLVEICGQQAQFREYCRVAIGEQKLAAIRKYLHSETS
jgi:hypothetical protein